MNELQPKSVRLTTLFLIVMIVITILVGGTAVRWAYQSSQVLIVKNTPVPALPPEVKDGDKVFLNIDYCKTSDAIGTTTVNLVGQKGAKIPINWPEDRSGEGCNKLEAVPVPIPAQTPTDTYHVEFKTCYNVNPLKKNRCTDFTSQDFKVTNSKLNSGDVKVQEIR